MKSFYGTAIVASCLAAAASAAQPENPLLSTTYEWLARASSTSEVLTLNLTNLAILLVFKILILGFGAFNFAQARSSDGGSRPVSVQKSDLTGGMCFMMYTSGMEEKLSCIQRTACEDPKTASEYLTAAKMWHKLHDLIKVPFDPIYYDIMTAVEEAKDVSYNGGACEQYSW